MFNTTVDNLLTPGILGCGFICGEVRQTERHRQSSHCSRTVDTVLRAHTVQGLWTPCWELTLFKDSGHCVESSHCSRTVDTVLRAHTVQGLWTLCWELTQFKDCGHCVENSHSSRTVDSVSRTHTVQGLWTLCCQTETQSSRCSLTTVSQSMDWDPCAGYGLFYKEVRHTDTDRARTVQRLWTICWPLLVHKEVRRAERHTDRPRTLSLTKVALLFQVFTSIFSTCRAKYVLRKPYSVS